MPATTTTSSLATRSSGTNKEQMMTPQQAIVWLSGLAADFKIGIVSDDYVREMLTSIVDSMQIDNKDEVLKDALGRWFIGDKFDSWKE